MPAEKIQFIITDNGFEELERESNEACKKLGLTRLACFSHSLQLVAKFNKDTLASALLSTAYQVVNSVNRSSKVTEALVDAAGKKLVSRCTTRWTTAYLVVRRLLQVKEELKKVLLDHNMTMLQPKEWEWSGGSAATIIQVCRLHQHVRYM